MMRKRPIVRLIIGLIALTLTVPISVGRAQNSPAQTDAPRVRGVDTCQEILVQAMGVAQEFCDNLGRNKACYGNNTVKVEPNASAVLKFDTVGDRAAIQDIRTLVTSPLDEQTGTWGLSLLKLQANLPDTVPGQNVTFIVFGNTTVDNTSTDMKAFYFSSGLGELSCQEVPHDGILVRSPGHTEVTFKANGVDIAIASTILMRAVRNQWMSVQLIEGHARVTTPQGSQTLQPGQAVFILLGGSNGLQPASAPSTPTKVQDNPAIRPMMGITDKIADPDAPPTIIPDAPATITPDVPATITISGCITATKGNFIVVNGYSINVGSDHTLKAAKVGDCVQITGVLKTNNGNGVEFVLVKAVATGKSNAASGTGQGNQGQGNTGNSNDNSSNSNSGNGNSNSGNGNSGNGNSGGNGNGNGNSGGNGKGNGNGNSGGNGNGKGGKKK